MHARWGEASTVTLLEGLLLNRGKDSRPWVLQYFHSLFEVPFGKLWASAPVDRIGFNEGSVTQAWHTAQPIF